MLILLRNNVRIPEDEIQAGEYQNFDFYEPDNNKARRAGGSIYWYDFFNDWFGGKNCLIAALSKLYKSHPHYFHQKKLFGVEK